MLLLAQPPPSTTGEDANASAAAAAMGNEGIRNTLLAEYGAQTFKLHEQEMNLVFRRMEENEDETKSLRENAMDDDDDEEDVLQGRGVWMSKKGEGLGMLTGAKKRFFLVVFGTFTKVLKWNYYAHVKHDVPVDKKGHVRLYPTSEFTAKGKDLTIKNPDRTWNLSASSAEDALFWATELQRLIKERYPNGQMPNNAAANEEEEILPNLGVWLQKKGEGLGAVTGVKKRYFVLVRGKQTGALRINYYANETNGRCVCK